MFMMIQERHIECREREANPTGRSGEGEPQGPEQGWRTGEVAGCDRACKAMHTPSVGVLRVQEGNIGTALGTGPSIQ